MGRAFIERLIAVKRRRERMREAILAAYDQAPAARVRRLEVAMEVAKVLGVSTVSPQFQVEVIRMAVSLGARTVAKGNARFYRGLRRRATDG